MPTDTAHGPIDAGRFVVRAVAMSLGFIVVARLPWTEAHIILPATRLQGAAATALFGTPAAPVEITLACSGTDAMALCLGAILAYPVAWRTRLLGAAVGAALTLGLNTLRIGTLGQVAASPAWFNTLHVYLWPAVLTVAIAGYVFGWMRLADRRHAAPDEGNEIRRAPESVRPPSTVAPARLAPQPSRRFIVLTIAFLLLFAAASPFYLESPGILALAGSIARAAALILGVAGLTAHAAGNVLWTARGGFVVTQECISTPLIPVYLAAICTYATTWRRLLLGVLATLPLFIAMGIARLLVLALPEAVASPTFFVHAFYQLLVAAVVVFVAALWRYGRSAAPARALAGVLAGVLFVRLFGPLYTRAFVHLGVVPTSDPQGALALLPEFQVGLYLALWVAAFVAAGWRRFAAGLALLWLTQTAGLFALQVLGSHTGLTAHVRDVRGWAIVAPVLIFAAVIHATRARR